MRSLFFLLAMALAATAARLADAQTVTLYTAGPEGLAKGIAKSFTDKTGIKVDLYQATSGDVLARLEAEKGNPRADVAVLASWGEGLAARERGLSNPTILPKQKSSGRNGAITAWRLREAPRWR